MQRGHTYAIVDEVDSILIDEARTPLIISGKVADAAQLYYKFASIVRSLKRDDDYEVDEEKRNVAPTDDGIEKVERQLDIENLYDGVAQNLVHQLQAALKAKELFKRDKDYVVADGEVKIVDEFTGRILEGRRWSEGLHQAVEAKEGVKIKEENQTLATVTLQNYFRMYDKLAGMTGTAQSDAAELAGTYDLQVVPIPTNKPPARLDEPDLIYKTEDAKFAAVVDDLAERYEKGQPVLVGTISVEKSEKLSRLLDKQGIRHEVLNAKVGQHFREGEIIAQAGRLSSVTVATNMAGRGVDIILGGNAEGMAKRDLRIEDLDPDADENRARLEELTAKHEADTKAEGDKVRELGGLYVLGTERHDSRRIDNQLRGRSGRQGDPGESRFYLSLDDDLMRLFATGAVNWVMGKTLPDDVPLEAKMVSKAIERAQTTVEQRNAEIRKNVLKYDEVMNEQRKVIYALRDQVLDRADLRERIVTEALPDTVSTLVETHCVSEYSEEWDVEALATEARTFWPSESGAERARQGQLHQRAVRAAHRRGARLLREARGDAQPRRDAPGRAPGHAAGDRPALAGPPLRDGLPARGHQPAGHGPEGSAGRVAARGLRHVRPDDARHLAGLRPLRHARRRQGDGARRRDGPGRRQGRPAGREARASRRTRSRATRRRTPPRASRTTGPTPRSATSATRHPTTPTVGAARPACRPRPGPRRPPPARRPAAPAAPAAERPRRRQHARW